MLRCSTWSLLGSNSYKCTEQKNNRCKGSFSYIPKQLVQVHRAEGGLCKTGRTPAWKQLVQVHRAEVAPGRKARGSPGKQLVQVHRAEDKLRALSAYLTIEATRTSAQSRNGNPLCLLGL